MPYSTLNPPVRISREVAIAKYGIAAHGVINQITTTTPLWEYISGDSSAEISGTSQYFSNGSTLGMAQGDVIFSRSVPGEAFAGLVVTYAASGAGVTVSTLDAGAPKLSIGRNGVDTVLFGDSMTDFYEFSPTVTAAYDVTTGTLTFTWTGHGRPTGTIGRFWCNTYMETQKARLLPLTRVDANTITAILSDKPTLAANLSGTVFLKAGGVNQFISWVGLMQMRLGHPLNIVANSAQNGDMAVNGLLRLDDHVFSYNPSLVVMQSYGANDISAFWQGGPFTDLQIIDNNTKIYDRILARGIKLILALLTPVVTGEARATKAYMQRFIRINRANYNYARANYADVLLVDSYGQIVNPTDTSGFANSLYINPVDKIHYSAQGAGRASTILEGIISSRYPQARSTLPESVLDYQVGDLLTVTGNTISSGGVVTVNSTAHGWKVGEQFFAERITQALANGAFNVLAVPDANSLTYFAPGLADGTLTGTLTFSKNNNLFANPLLTTATGGNLNTTGNVITGAVAGNMSVSNNTGAGSLIAVASVAAAASGFGNEQVVTITGAALNDTPTLSSFGTTAFALRMLPNRRYRFEGRLRLNSNSWVDTPVSEIFARLDMTWSTGEIYYMQITSTWDSSPVTLTSDQSWHLRSSDFLSIPPQPGSTITASNWTIFARFSGVIANAETLVMGLSQPSIRDVGPV